MTRVSIAMCTYNGEKYLSEQLVSILEQTLMPWELVVCDDRSTDGTIKILQDFASIAPFPVRVIRNRVNLGSTQNFEQCIQMCDGDFIALSDQDDVWAPHKLETLTRILDDDQTIGAIFSDAALIDANSALTGDALWARMLFTPELQNRLAEGDASGVLLQTPIVTGATMMFRASLRDQAFPIPEPWVHDAWIAWIATISSRLVSTSECLTYYRLHASQQLGLPVRPRNTRPTLAETWQKMRAIRDQERKRYTQFATEYEELRRFLMRQKIGSQEQLNSIGRKASFSEFLVLNLARPRIRRLLESLAYVSDYRRMTPHRAMTILRHSLL